MEIKVTKTKTELREAFKQKRDAFVMKQDKTQLQKQLANNLAKVLPKEPRLWASYRSIQSEADPSVAEVAPIQWCYPVISKDGLEFYVSNGEWTQNQFHVQEPNPKISRKVSMGEIQGVLVPGIAFDLKGHRLGWGKAYYDKTLKDFSGVKIGIAYSVQMTESLPFEAHDICMDMIVTEKEILKIQ